MGLAGNTKGLRYGLLLSALALALWFKFFYEPSYVGTGQPYDRIVGEIADPRRFWGNGFVRPDPADEHGIARDVWSAPESHWLGNEKRIAGTYLSGVDVTLLILPVQADRNAFDTIERSLLTRLVSDRVAQRDENIVANPTSVLRYLGSHRSTYPAEDVESLARLTRADRVLVLHAEHDRRGLWELTGSLHDDEFGPATATRSWSNLRYSDAEPPSVALEQILGEIVEFATGESIKRARSRSGFDADAFQFPGSVDDLTRKARLSPVHAAAYLQLIGMLHPRGSFNETRNHLFERSLVELNKVSPKAPYYNYFKARAYAYLGRRPAAIAVLDRPSNEHETALLAVLNGNLPGLQQFIDNAGVSVLDFMSLIDAPGMEQRYGAIQERNSIELFTQAHPPWAAFIYRSFLDHEYWANYSAATIKMGLEELLPADGITLEGQFAKQIATGEMPSELELARLLWRHIEALEAEDAPRWALDKDNYSNVSALDILELAKTTAVANHLREIDDDLRHRGIPEAALKEISEFDSIFSGHPAVTLKKGEALQKLAADARGSENENLVQRAAETLLNGYAWTGQLTQDAIAVARDYGALLSQSSLNRDASTSYTISNYSRRYFEWPKGMDWYYKLPQVEVYDGSLDRCVNYTWTAFECLQSQIMHSQRRSATPDVVRSELLAANSHRFVGHPAREKYEVEYLRTQGDEDDEVRLLQSQIKAGSQDWFVHYNLGRAYMRRGDYKAAQDVWLSYPGFRNPDPRSPITNDNNADIAGAMLYWIGQFELALPLLEIAASSGTGSASSMTSAVRVSLINGDLEGATDWSAARVRRYDSIYAFRDLLQLLHIRGDSELAWSVFDQAQSMRQDSQMWSGALVGHRMSSADIPDITEWIEASESRKNAKVEREGFMSSIYLAPRYLLMAGTMDRAPSPGFAKLVSNSYGEFANIKSNYQRALESSATEDISARESNAFVVGATGMFHHDRLVPTPVDEEHFESGQAVEHRYAMLAEAMAAFLAADHDRSFALFNETAYLYDLEEFLPYYAFSAAAVGSSGHLTDALSAREAEFDMARKKSPQNPSWLGFRFNEDLTYAVLASFEGNHEEAVRYLRRALSNRPYINDRAVYPLYQIVDLADRFYERTGVESYRDFALDLSRRHTVVLPMYSWAYFIVAKYSKSEVERIGAAASGLKLDPLSQRGSLLPKDLRDEAKELLMKHGAPYLRRTKETMVLGT